MEREIKFRVWDEGFNRMVHPIGIDWETKDKMIMYYWATDKDGISKIGMPCHKELSNIMQYTGLKDKNRKEIYEGDICRFYPNKEETIYFHGLAYINDNVVGGQWEIIRCDNIDSEVPEIKGQECLDSSSFWNDDFEIIGNIHQNPALLK